MKRVHVELTDGTVDTYDVLSYGYDEHGVLRIEMCDDNGVANGVVLYPDMSTKSVTEWFESESESDSDNDNAAGATGTTAHFKVGETVVLVGQCCDGIFILDETHCWCLLQLQPDGVHLYRGIGDDSGFELESHEAEGGDGNCNVGYLKTRWDR